MKAARVPPVSVSDGPDMWRVGIPKSVVWQRRAAVRAIRAAGWPAGEPLDVRFLGMSPSGRRVWVVATPEALRPACVEKTSTDSGGGVQ